MQKVTEATGSKSAMLAYRDLEQPQASFQFSYNISQEILELYAHKYSAIDPFFELSAKTVPLGKTSADHKMVPDRQELEHICGEFFTGMMKPFDLWHIGGAHFFRDENRSAAIALQRGQEQGPWSDEELALVDVLVPHFQRAFIPVDLVSGIFNYVFVYMFINQHNAFASLVPISTVSADRLMHPV